MAVDVGSAVGYLDLDISGFLNGLKTAQSEANAASNNIATKIGNGFTSVGNKLSSAGTKLTATVTTSVIGLGTAAVKTTSDFETAMSKVSAISGATGDDLDALNQKAQEMGAKTKFSATESAEAFTYMAMAGWKTQDMLEGIEGIMSLAAADGLDLATTSDIVTDALTAFGLSAADSGHFADVLAKAASNANTNVSLLGESFKYVAPVAGALGYSAEDTAIALGLMANAGIKGSQGGTALRASISRLVKPTGDAVDMMEQYGISLTNTDGSMKSLQEVMDMLRDKLGNLTEAEQAQVAAQLFGQEAMSGMLAIINASDSDYEKLTNAIYNADGAAQQMADTMIDNLGGQITLLKSALEGLAIQFGEILMPYLKKFVSWLQELIIKFQNLTPEQKDQIIKWGAILAALGPVLLIVGKLTSGIGSMITTFGKLSNTIPKVIIGFKNFGEGFKLAKAGFSGLAGQAGGLGTKLGSMAASIGPWGIAIVAAIAVVIAAFTNLWKNNEEFREKILAVWNQVKETFNKLCQGIVDRLNSLGFNFENIGEVIKAIWDAFCNYLAPTFQFAFQTIANVFDLIVNSILNTFDFWIAIFKGDWDGAWEAVKNQFSNIWNFISRFFSDWWDNFKQVWNTIIGWFGTSWSECWSSIKQFFVDIWNGIDSFFKNVGNNISSFFVNTWNNIKTFFVNTWNNILISVAQWGANMKNKAVETGTNFIESIKEFFSNLPYYIGYYIGAAAGAVASWAVNMWNKAIETGRNFINAIVEFFTQLPQRISEFATSAYENVSTWATNMRNKAFEAGSNFINAIVSFFSQLPGKILGFVTNVYNTVSSWASNMWNKALEVGRNFLNGVVSFFSQLPAKIASFLSDIISRVSTWATNLASKAKQAASNVYNNIVNGIKEIPAKITEVGKNLVQGLWSGITSAGSWLKDKINSFGNGIIDGFKKTFNINSPSKETEALGEFITQGLGVGMENEEGGLLSVIQTIFNDVMNKLNSMLSSIQNLFTGNLFSDEETSALDMYNTTLLTTLNIYKMLSEQMKLCVEYAKSFIIADSGLLKLGPNQNGASSLSNFNNTDIETLKDLILSVLGKDNPDGNGGGNNDDKPDQLVIPISIGDEQIETVIVDLLKREVRT